MPMPPRPSSRCSEYSPARAAWRSRNSADGGGCVTTYKICAGVRQWRASTFDVTFNCERRDDTQRPDDITMTATRIGLALLLGHLVGTTANAQEITALRITPANRSVAVGDSLRLRVQALDARGNV